MSPHDLGPRSRCGSILSLLFIFLLAGCSSTDSTNEPDPVEPEPMPPVLTEPEVVPPAPRVASATGRVALWEAARTMGLKVSATGRPGERRLQSADGRTFVLAADSGTYTFDGSVRMVPEPGIAQENNALLLPLGLLDRMRQDLRLAGSPERPVAASNALQGRRIVLDAGHGGKDPGAKSAGGVLEKEIVLPLTREVTRLLRARGASVTTTRDDDSYPSLDDRVELASRARAEVFVSIHANSTANTAIYGVECFHPTEGRRGTASRELANDLAFQVAAAANTANRGAKGNPRELRVLKNTAMPAALIEVGFLSNREEASRLARADHRSAIALGIVNGLDRYFQRTTSRP